MPKKTKPVPCAGRTKNLTTVYGRQIRIYGNMVQVVGVDFETNRITVVARDDKHVVLRIPGRSCWDGIGMPRRYAPVEILVYKILRTSGDSLIVEPLIGWVPGVDP